MNQFHLWMHFLTVSHTFFANLPFLSSLISELIQVFSSEHLTLSIHETNTIKVWKTVRPVYKFYEYLMSINVGISEIITWLCKMNGMKSVRAWPVFSYVVFTLHIFEKIFSEWRRFVLLLSCLKQPVLMVLVLYFSFLK